MNDKQLQEAAEYTEGICGEAAAILKDGVMMTIPEILKELNSRVEPIAVPLSVKSGEDDWGKLRDKFFKECTKMDSVDGCMIKIDYAPHDLFEWFKRHLTTAPPNNQ